MRGGPILKKIIYSSAFLACFPALITIFFLPSLGSKYTLLIEQEGKHSGQYLYTDLNSDSISEIIYTGKGIPYYFISIRDNELHFFDQWNLKDSTDLKISEVFFGNYDNDRFEEIYIFTHKGDSLFLNMNEMLGPAGTRLDRVFITKIGYLQGEVTSVLKPGGFFDNNDDGLEEVYFGITTGFGADPRRLYAFDLVNKKLISSQFTGIICMDPRMSDIDDDKRPEIFGFMSACGNFGSKVPFSDSSTWFMVFNDNLKFEFPPEEFRGYVNGLETKTFDTGKTKGYILGHSRQGTDTTVLASRILIYSPQGKLIRQRLVSDFSRTGTYNLFVNRYNSVDRIYILEDDFLELNDKLEVIQRIKLPFSSKLIPYQVDVNGDGEDEFLLYSINEEKLAVYGPNLKKLAELSFTFPDVNLRFSHSLNKGHLHKLYMTSGENGYFFNLKRNKYYYLGFLAYPGIYTLFLLFIIVIKKINTRQVIQKESLKRRLVTLQLQGIKSQLDPHFTFNTLNSVASLIYFEDRQAAYDYMIKFTQLLRSMLNDAERVYRSLGEELDFVTTYLDLEKQRYGEKFIYKIEIGEGVSQREQVPKLVLHTFAENSIKHGIVPGSDAGLLNIIIIREADYLKLTIEDNGIGRARAAGRSTSTGRGLKITREFYDILNEANKKPIKHLITDLHSASGDATGTRVDVWVPVEEI
jgi:two-component sensor histidine kinase